MLARVKSVLRRATGAIVAAGPRVRMGRRVLDLERRVLVDPADGSEETLTASEFDLLKVFAFMGMAAAVRPALTVKLAQPPMPARIKTSRCPPRE